MSINEVRVRFPNLIDNYFGDGLRLVAVDAASITLMPLRRYFNKDEVEKTYVQEWWAHIEHQLQGLTYTITHEEFNYMERIHLKSQIRIQC
jgi:hypothetical protein